MKDRTHQYNINRCKERRIAVQVLESIAQELGKETIFDCKNGDDKWYRFEDLVTDILIRKPDWIKRKIK